MYRFLTGRRLGVLFVAVFGLALTVLFVFQRVWLDPGERCEAQGRWYDVTTRTCATPIYIPDITGRPAGVSRAEASAAKNRELVELETQVQAERAAVRADAERQRARLEAERQAR